MVTSVVRRCAWCVVRGAWSGGDGRGIGGCGAGQGIGLFSWSLIYFCLRIYGPRFVIRRGAGEHHCPYYVRNVRAKICRQTAICGFLLTFLDFCWVARDRELKVAELMVDGWV